MIMNNFNWFQVVNKLWLKFFRIRFIRMEIKFDNQKKWLFLLPSYVFIFVLFHGCRLYGTLYQLFHETKRYHPGNDAEERLYLGGLDPACVDQDDNGRLIKNAYSKKCLREVDYAIWTLFGIAWVLSVPIFLFFGMTLK